MPNPNEPEQPKKPQPPMGKPAQPPQGAKPGQPPTGKPAQVPPQKPPTPTSSAGTPAMGKIVPQGDKPAAAKAPVKPTPPQVDRPPAPKAPVKPPPPAKPGAAPAPAKPASAPGAAAPGAAAQGAAAQGAAPAKPAAKTGDQQAVPASKVKPAPVKSGTAGRTTGRRIGQVLVDLGYIDESQLWELLDEAKNSGVHLGQAALSRGLVTENQLMQALADQFGMKLLSPEELKPTSEALTLVPEPMATVYKILPLTFKDKVLTVAMGDPNNLPSLDDLRNFLSIPDVVACLAPQNAINDVLSRCYHGKEETIRDIITGLQSMEDLGPRKSESSIDLESWMEMQEAAPVRKLLNMVMLLAIKDRASDIHFEPFEDEYKLRYRCDGIMYEMVPPPRHLAMAISSRIKVMSNLDIAERRLPQDGRIELNVGGNQVDMRVSVLPTMFGESCVIRVLDRGNVGLDLNRIGMEPELISVFRELIKKPNGITLVTGPTGSGKTTTLYSALNELNEITDKIITCEDPVEYDIDGIIQCPINTDIGVTFANILRSILRQDPDKILVGEIRDLETAQIAVQAALTGHMVFSTLHTNDAPSTITRLRDMGLDTYLITATLESIMAQRLVRKICDDCRTEFEPSPEMLMELGLRPADVVGKKFYYGRGCDRCHNTGHRGRMGLFELIAINDELRDMISAGASTDQLRSACRKMGMNTLREAGMNAIFSGLTTIDEVVRETIEEND